jgi:hypothetical protein
VNLEAEPVLDFSLCTLGKSRARHNHIDTYFRFLFSGIGEVTVGQVALLAGQILSRNEESPCFQGDCGSLETNDGSFPGM